MCLTGSKKSGHGIFPGRLLSRFFIYSSRSFQKIIRPHCPECSVQPCRSIRVPHPKTGMSLTMKYLSIKADLRVSEISMK